MSNFETVTIRVPATPTRHQSPNGRTHWRNRYRDDNHMKATTAWAIKAAGITNLPPLPWTVDYVVAWEPRRQMTQDDDNVIGSLKSLRDALAKELGIDDRQMTTGTVTQIRDKAKAGYVEVKITGGAS